MAKIDPKDFGDGMKGHVTRENWRDSGYDHHTVYGEGSDPSRVSWNEVEYTDSNGDSQREVVDVHTQDNDG